ncbi:MULTISPECIES: preprotein translocase subunit YajC [unclassified Enterococcus]|uniref:preprotein translocase subunit YajC n=1 Tax=unclassified Enterococcus TaxID=2608891 RepID=UPI0015552E14|nr:MULTISPECIES: preprotein translocase subunit YajC [unclassified Enterococcus]MBS7578265.1 preprotein translocase subunit YajC [Enterococcus sp. MMGLQ5-2]MBS7585445.1 preprotein translocase subunit YajC [Enterococcus sp. MMGLQ5-1]NPD13302.1 preprotein translocase subunit YajC [Enterococcus sp. MMGLQ5-1]NPD38096.1 preprotein translocase subunit YajC [Enterococcus sp. MMGLQ5-2]
MQFIIIIVAMVGLMWFMQRGQKKQAQQRQELLNNMKPGDEIVTIGGLHGVLSELDETNSTITLDCEGVYLEFDRAAVKTVKPSAVGTESIEIDETVVASTEPSSDAEQDEAAEDKSAE